MYTIVTHNIEYESNWATKNFVKNKCRLLVTNVDTLEAQRVAVAEGLYVIGSNVDSRLELGDLILTSPVVKWSELYAMTLDQAFNNTLHHITEFEGYEDDTVFLSDYSPFVTQDIRIKVSDERDRMLKEGPMNYIFKGPVNDNTGKEVIPPDVVPTIEQLYSMNWTIENVVSFDWTMQYPKHNDNNLSPGLLDTTYAFMGTIYLLVLVLGIWTVYNREHPVIKFAQPIFLLVLLLGILIGITTVFPLSFQIPVSDEEAYTLGQTGIEDIRDREVDLACQSLGWLLITGYGLTIPVLILKTWRLHNIIVKAKLGGSHRRKKALGQFELLSIVFAYLFIAYLLLTTWQLISPMSYRVHVLAFDAYNNPIESYGFCYIPASTASASVFVILVLFVVLIIFIGNIVCFIARNDETVNNEVTFITLAMVNFLQVVIVGGPIVIILVERPTPRFVVSAAAVILGFGGLLGLIFSPKVVAIVFYDADSAQYTIRAKSTGGRTSSTSVSNTVTKGEIKIPSASDPQSNPASNFTVWRRNSKLSSVSDDRNSIGNREDVNIEIGSVNNPIRVTGEVQDNSSESNSRE
jgi:hypothetical protein